MPATASQRAAPATRLTLVTICPRRTTPQWSCRRMASLGRPRLASRERQLGSTWTFRPSSVSQGAVSPENPVVRRVRVALHSDSPRVTRVEVDLVREAAYHVEPSPLDPNRFVITFATSADPAVVAKTAAPQPRKPRTGTPDAPEARSRPPVRATRRHRGAAAVIARLERLRPLLKAIDDGGSTGCESSGRGDGVGLNRGGSGVDQAVQPERRSQGSSGPGVRAGAQAVRARMESEASGNAAPVGMPCQPRRAPSVCSTARGLPRPASGLARVLTAPGWPSDQGRSVGARRSPPLRRWAGPVAPLVVDLRGPVVTYTLPHRHDTLEVVEQRAIALLLDVNVGSGPDALE